MDLINKKCVPCEGGTKPLDLAAAQKYLALVPLWQLDQGNGAITREIVFKDFASAINFINQLAALAEVEGHHPDFCLFSWNHVKLTLSTHAIKGLSENDFILAVKTDQLLKKYPLTS
jgi:4a-hydroxytetrahydrobiopterin dehydratase